MKRWLVVFAAFALAGSAGAVDLFRGRLLNPNDLHASDHGEHAPRLYDARTQALQPSAGIYAPNRVYSVFHQGEQKWVYAITNTRGKFAEPFEFFYPGSMVVGSEVGGDPRDTYVLTSKYEWQRTPSPFRQQLLLVLAEPPFFKRVHWYRTDLPAKK